MLPEENGLRRALAQRSFRSAEEIWPALRQELAVGRTRRLVAAWSAVAVLVIVLLAVLLGRSEPAGRRLPSIGFRVTNVRSLGRPAASIVLRPDPETVMIVVD